jgi:hypothetical protein
MSFFNDLDAVYDEKQKTLTEMDKTFTDGINTLTATSDIFEERIDEAAANVISTIYAMIKNDKNPVDKLGTSTNATDKNTYLDQLGKFFAAIEAAVEVGPKQPEQKQTALSRVLDAAQFNPDDAAFKKLLILGDAYKSGKVYFTWREKIDDYVRALAVKSGSPQEYEKIKNELGKEIQLLATKFQQASGKLARVPGKENAPATANA